LSGKPSNFFPQINISGQLGSDKKLTLDEQKRHIDNNLYMYYDDKSYRDKSYKVKTCPLYLFKTTRFQTRYIEAIPSALEATLAT